MKEKQKNIKTEENKKIRSYFAKSSRVNFVKTVRHELKPLNNSMSVKPKRSLNYETKNQLQKFQKFTEVFHQMVSKSLKSLDLNSNRNLQQQQLQKAKTGNVPLIFE